MVISLHFSEDMGFGSLGISVVSWRSENSWVLVSVMVQWIWEEGLRIVLELGLEGRCSQVDMCQP